VNGATIVKGLFFLSIAAYPFIIFFGFGYLPPSFFGLVLLALLGMRFGVLRPEERPVLLPLLVTFAVYALVATLLRSPTMLLLYPAMVNLSLCTIFVVSLWQGDPLLLRFIRARGWPISSHGPRYLYRLTAVWAGFFAVNRLISVWTISFGIEVWTLYNGLIAYFLVAVLIGGEYLFRRLYKRRMEINDLQ
jgi:uncharacterized membrane protein